MRGLPDSARTWWRELGARSIESARRCPGLARAAGGRLWTGTYRFADYSFFVLFAYRIPLLLALLAFVLLWQPQQIRELYVLTLGDGFQGWIQVTLVLLLIFMFSMTLVVLSDVASRYFRRPKDGLAFKVVDTGVKIICALLPITAVQQGANVAINDRFNENFVRFHNLHQDYVARYGYDRELAAFAPELVDWQSFPGFIHNQLIFSSAIGILLIIFFLTPYARRIGHRAFERFIGGETALVESPLYRVVLVLTGFFVLLFLTPNVWSLPDLVVEIPRAIGTLGIILIFLILFSFHLAMLSEVGDRRGYPVLTVLAIAVLLFSYFDLNDNHEVRYHQISKREWKTVPTNPLELVDRSDPNYPLASDIMVSFGGKHYMSRAEPKLPTLQEHFVAWLAERPADVKARFAQTYYPVYIVGAEGGGIYAAAQTAIFLARLYDRCPSLTNHIFAISAVSGGSLGASLVAALILEKQKQLGPKATEYFSSCSGKPPSQGEAFFETTVKKLLAVDHLSPSIAAALFPDFLQRFIPAPIAVLDRARSLERSFEQSWSKIVSVDSNPFAEKFRDHWSPAGFAPMLMLNTTVAEAGVQAIVAPFTAGSEDRNLYSFFGSEMSPRYDIPLSTAVGLSARFTVLAPPGHHVDRDGADGGIHGRTSNLVDGGYVDGSGVETMTAATLAIQTLVRNENQEPADPVSDLDASVLLRPWARVLMIGNSGRPYSPAGLDEIISPVAAMYNARVQRALRAIAGIRESDPHAGPVGIAWSYFNPPLGWFISPYTIETIGAHIGTAERCDGPSFGDPFTEESFSHRVQVVGGDLGRIIAMPRHEYLFSFRHALKSNHCTACAMIQFAQGQQVKEFADVSCMPGGKAERALRLERANPPPPPQIPK